MKKSLITYLIFGLSLYLLSSGVSYFAFSRSTQASTPKVVVAPTKPPKKAKVDPSLPRTEICPLNGALFTTLEKNEWVTRRPLGIMIENSLDSRPQSGLSSADIVYEAVAEGGITRFMGMYYCDAALSGNITIAPVRSARIYFVNLISEYDGLYAHVGGAGNCDDPNVDPRAKALCAIQRYSIKDLDQFGRAGDYKTCHRMANRLDKEVAYEHTMACFLDELYNVGAKWNWTNVDSKKVSWDKNFVSWKFKDLTEKATGSPATTISYMFWESNREFNKDYDVEWKFDSTTGSYARYNGGQLVKDLNTDESLQFKTVIVQKVKETFAEDVEKHMLYEVIGQGKATVFMDGVAIDATWSKVARTSRTIYKDLKGKEIKLNPGTIWISLVPSTNTITYK
jgi:hypothetical protein